MLSDLVWFRKSVGHVTIAKLTADLRAVAVTRVLFHKKTLSETFLYTML